jgi:translation initiation factor IF-1
MPKNVGGGKRYKKRKNKGPVEPGPLTYADREQSYGIVTKRLGNGLVELVISKDCETPRPALGKIRGILRKRRVPFNVGSVVIVSGRECLSSSMVGKGSNRREKVDVLHCYYDDEAKRLYREKRIPQSFKTHVETFGLSEKTIQMKKQEEEDDALIVFDDEEPSEMDVDIDNL